MLFSGGTDSMLSAALMAEKYKKIYLITYNRFGLFSVSNSKINVQKLKNKFGEDKFTHRIIRIDKLSKYVFYERYFHNFIKHRFFLLSICGLCKLAMHIRTVIFCLNNKIANVCDGANQTMRLFPGQMPCVIKEIKMMYAKFRINYMNPVFDSEYPSETDFFDRLHLKRILPIPEKEKNSSFTERTAGYRLFKIGLLPSGNVKGTKLDHRMQPRCFQFILFNIFVIQYYLYDHTYEEYEEATLRFHKEKIGFFTKLLEEYIKKGKKSKLINLIEN